MTPKIIEIANRIPLLFETETGIFRLVESIEIGEKINFHYMEKSGIHRIERDIIEFVNHNLELLLEIQSSASIAGGIETMPYIIEKLRDYLEISNSDYVGLKTYGGRACEYLATDGNTHYFKMMPRGFRKIPLDDRI